MIRVKTLTVQLIDAQPDRIRICRIDGESLVTVVVPKEDLTEAKSLPNIPQRGVYYLLDEDHGNVSRVYAGQTTQGIARLDALHEHRHLLGAHGHADARERCLIGPHVYQLA